MAPSVTHPVVKSNVEKLGDLIDAGVAKIQKAGAGKLSPLDALTVCFATPEGRGMYGLYDAARRKAS